jgi:tetratricopeptide (TPR) repeat protein
MDADTYFSRGNARQHQGDSTGAIKDYDETIRLDARHMAGFVNRGGLRAQQGDLEGALADCDEAVRINPDFPGTYFNRGKYRASQGNYAGALQDYQRFLELDGGRIYGIDAETRARQQIEDLKKQIKG